MRSRLDSRPVELYYEKFGETSIDEVGTAERATADAAPAAAHR
jgi:hypothetical protein